MTGGPDDPASAEPGSGGRARLRPVVGPVLGQEPPPAVRLLREWKGPTVADLLSDELAQRLPGQMWSVLQQLERGDLAGAERRLPGQFAPLLPGPGHHRAERRWLVATVVLAAAAVATALAAWLQA